MIGQLVLAATAVQVVSSASPEALALARVIHPPAPLYAGGSRPVAVIADAVAHDLLSTRSVQRGPGCNPDLPACREAAHRFAADFANRLVAARQELADQALALAIDERVAPADMTEARRIAATPAGRNLLLAALDFGNPTAGPKPFLEAVERLGSQSRIGDWTSEYDRFFDATKSLPRAPEPRVVAPPAPPPIRSSKP